MEKDSKIFTPVIALMEKEARIKQLYENKVTRVFEPDTPGLEAISLPLLPQP